MKEYLDAMQNNYANFSGRARRQQYWMFILFMVIFGVLAAVIEALLGQLFNNGEPIGIIFAIFGIGHVIPYLAIIVRRLHDVGKSGWFYFIRMIPIIGPIWLFVLLVTDSENKPNKWGESPKYSSHNDYEDDDWSKHLVD